MGRYGNDPSMTEPEGIPLGDTQSIPTSGTDPATTVDAGDVHFGEGDTGRL